MFARASECAISGSEDAKSLTNDSKLISLVKELRGKAAQMVGMCKNWESVDEESPMSPMINLVSAATQDSCQLQCRLFLDNKCHTSMAGTGGICTAACSRLPGTIVNELVKSKPESPNVLNIQHPLGLMPISVENVSQDVRPGQYPEFKTLSFVRTARRIMDGRLYLPDVLEKEILEA